MSDTDEPEVVEGEVIISELQPSDEERTLWVYHPDDDYKITIPAGARVTFGYFNPAAAGSRIPNTWDRGGKGETTMKTTCLRVYDDKTDKSQIGAFIGVTGFRDLSKIKKTVMRRSVTITTNLEEDAIGNTKFAAAKQIEPAAVNEDDGTTIPF